ncbi:MAG: CRISPR system precrRNA processing endoribonuclease RAMP protein Cas6, partial [Candidatus Tectomicrobia bacterium]|nr:CRISPR system precrRNA processing endoribonuclease RAMP protein Cas6 [Candidatus Tectomicrobia bacterium]
LPYFVLAFSELGKVGLGKGPGRYQLREVFGLDESGGRQRLYASEKGALLGTPTLLHPGRPQERDCARESLALRFLTPTRIRYQEDLCLDLEFHILIRSLLRRLSSLAYFHCGLDPEGLDFRSWIARAETVGLGRRELRWYDWERYSVRQYARMMLGGFVGEVSFVGELGPFMPMIRLGEWLHAGKGTSFGLGRYEVMEIGFRRNFL